MNDQNSKLLILSGLIGIGLFGLWYASTPPKEEGPKPTPLSQEIAKAEKKRREEKRTESLQKIITKNQQDLKSVAYKRELARKEQERMYEAHRTHLAQQSGSQKTFEQQLEEDLRREANENYHHGLNSVRKVAEKVLGPQRLWLHAQERNPEKAEAHDQEQIEVTYKNEFEHKFKSFNRRLIHAVEVGDLVAAQQAITNGASVHFKDENGYTALHHACIEGNESATRFLLKQKASIHAETNNQQTPLHLAALSNNTDLVDLLERNGAVQRKDKFGKFPIDLIKDNPTMYKMYRDLKEVKKV